MKNHEKSCENGVSDFSAESKADEDVKAEEARARDASPDQELSGFSSFFIVFSWFCHGFSIVFHCFFKELDFKELEIHRYSLLDIHQ